MEPRSIPASRRRSGRPGRFRTGEVLPSVRAGALIERAVGETFGSAPVADLRTMMLHAVSWGAVFAGATDILNRLGLGPSTVDPIGAVTAKVGPGAKAESPGTVGAMNDVGSTATPAAAEAKPPEVR